MDSNGRNHSLANSFSRIGETVQNIEMEGGTGTRQRSFSVFPPLSLSLPRLPLPPPFFSFLFFPPFFFFVYRMLCTLRVGFDRISQFTPGLSIKPSAILLMATVCFLSGTTINFRLDPPISIAEQMSVPLIKARP